MAKKLTAKLYVQNKLTNTETNHERHIMRVSFYNDKNVKVGSAMIEGFDAPMPFMFNLNIYKKYRRQGYGDAAVKYMINHFKIKTLTVECSNKIAIHLYVKNKFGTTHCFNHDGKSYINMKYNHKVI